MKCEKCGEHLDGDGPDPCLGMLPNVLFACCGHGRKGAYIAFGEPRHSIRSGSIHHSPGDLGYSDYKDAPRTFSLYVSMTEFEGIVEQIRAGTLPADIFSEYLRIYGRTQRYEELKQNGT